MSNQLTLIALEGIPLVQPGADLSSLIADALTRLGETLVDGDILVVAQKIVSIATITPSTQAETLAKSVDKDPRVVEVILRESRAIIREKPGVLIVENNLGLIMANAGIDHSNVESPGPDEILLLLPLDPDASAEALRRDLNVRYRADVGIGTTGLAIGVAGLPAVVDLRGDKDLFGRELRVSEEAVADELAAAASLLQGQGAEGKPVVLVRGFSSSAEPQPATAALRPPNMDMFR
jgi:coenzyme F420-0:L-glutamate ligase/coenzyme F420-1:gamma-L-glutamate ligase